MGGKKIRATHSLNLGSGSIMDPQQIYPHSKAGPLLFRSQRKAPEVRWLVSGHLGLAALVASVASGRTSVFTSSLAAY